MYKAQKVQKYALNLQLQALQNLTNDDGVENLNLSSFLLAVPNDYKKLFFLLNFSGAGLYPCLALLNHSCDPSFMRCNKGNEVICVASKVKGSRFCNFKHVFLTFWALYLLLFDLETIGVN